jgi:hypothetical protein
VHKNSKATQFISGLGIVPSVIQSKYGQKLRVVSSLIASRNVTYALKGLILTEPLFNVHTALADSKAAKGGGK